jgi:ribosomal protein S18 acetylase RimI-like enzyme
VNVGSLGYRTDVMLRALEGGEVTDRDGYIVVRSPANPNFWWGNFLLLRQPPGPGEAGDWLARFAAEFPDAGHVALGIDVTDERDVELTGFLDAGLRLDLGTVMTAAATHSPPRPHRLAQCRPLASDDDWRQAGELRVACGASPADRAFWERMSSQARQLTGTGRGSWFGAFQDGRLVAQLGLFSAGDGIARFQSVETHPGARRQGLAGTLVCHAGRYGVAELGARTLVIVADAGSDAARIYESVGFRGQETQIGLDRPPTGHQGPG